MDEVIAVGVIAWAIGGVIAAFDASERLSPWAGLAAFIIFPLLALKKVIQYSARLLVE